MQLPSVTVHFLVSEATFSENTLLHGGYIFSLKRIKTLNFFTCICIAVVDNKKPCMEPWKYFTSSEQTSILTWFAENNKLHDDSPDYCRMKYVKDFDEKAATFTNAVGEHCKGIQLANHVKHKWSIYMRISKPHTKIGAPPLDESTLTPEEVQIYHAFHKSIGKKHITRMSRSVRNCVVSKNQFLSLHCELYTGFVLVGSVRIPWLLQDFLQDKNLISRANKSC